jgi:hypothetical protein
MIGYDCSKKTLIDHWGLWTWKDVTTIFAEVGMIYDYLGYPLVKWKWW